MARIVAGTGAFNFKRPTYQIDLFWAVILYDPMQARLSWQRS